MSNENGQISEKKLKVKAERMIQFRKSVKINFSLFIIVNLLLVVINYLFNPFIENGNVDFQAFWALYPIFGWLIGVMMHLTAYFLYANSVEPLGNRMIIFHIVGYLFVNLFLVIINLITSPSIFWAIYPLIFWGAGLIAHIVIYFVYFSNVTTKSGKGMSRKERAIEKEMEKIRSKRNE
ncbi:MAG: 2TM domain-containing protein [Promethearchaeia archaeon]